MSLIPPLLLFTTALLASTGSSTSSSSTDWPALSSSSIRSARARAHAPVNTVPFVAEARQKLPLSVTGDGLHLSVELFVGGQRMALHVDTSTGSLMVLDVAECARATTPAGKFAPFPCFNTTASTTWSTIGSSSWGLRIDQERISMQATTGSELVAMEPVQLSGAPLDVRGDGAARTSLSYLVYVGDNVVRTNSRADAQLQTLAYTNGVMGLTGAYVASLFNAYQAHAADTDFESPVFSILTPGDDGVSGELHVGGAVEPYASRLVWSERLEQSSRAPLFTVFDLTVCGVRPGANVSSSQVGILDTGASCLTLPPAFFDSVMAWTPLECQPNTVCVLPDDLQVEQLPTVSFRLAQQGPLLHILLSDLVLPRDGSNPRKMCLLRGAVSDPIAVHFGSRVLHSLYVTVHVRAEQVAFANKGTLTARDVLCNPRPTCAGKQQYDPAFNACNEPDCDEYILYDLDEDAHECVLSVGFHSALVIFVVMLISAELIMNECTDHFRKRLRSRFGSS